MTRLHSADPEPHAPGREPASPATSWIQRLVRVAGLALAGLLAPGVVLASGWININPGAGGAFTSIGAGPTGTIVCGSDLSGAYRSRDRGKTWDIIGATRGLGELHVSAVAFDPADASIIYLGSENGLYRSANGGDTFQKILSSGYITTMAVSRSNPSVAYAAYHTTYESLLEDIYRTTDRGQTWVARHTNVPAGTQVLKIIVHPTNPDLLYMVSGVDDFIAGTPALYRSTDGGVNWSRIGSTLGNVWDLAIDPATPATLYATVYLGTPDVSWSGFVYKSTDGGNTWTQKAGHTGAVLVRRDLPQVVRVIDPDRDSSEPESGVWESQDGGNTWQRKSMAGWDAGWQDLNWGYGAQLYGLPKTLGEDLSDPNTIFWITAQFVHGSFDGGGRFQNLFTNEVSPGRWRSRGIEDVAVMSVAFSEANPSQIYTGYYDLGLWRSLDGGAGWESCNQANVTGLWKGFGGNTAAIVADPARAQVVWATNGEQTHLAVLAKSASAGAAGSWVPANGLPFGFLYGLSLDRTSPATQRTLFVTADGDVYRSQDDGANWTKMFDCNTCRSTTVDRFDGNLIYAGGEGGLWRSTSGGAPGSWARIGPAEFSGANSSLLKEVQWEGVHQILPDPQSAGRVYVAAYGSGRGLYRSPDRGTTWTRLRSATYMRGVAVDPTNSSVIYATSSNPYKHGGSTVGSDGVLRSTDGGQTWTSLNDGLAWPFAGPVAIDPANPSRIIVGSPGTGFFERTLGPPGPDATPPAAVTDLGR